MTRLKYPDIKNITGQLADYDKELLQKTGRTLRGIACHAVKIKEENLQSQCGSVSIGVVPIRSGKGVIRGFSETVAQIVRHIGFNAFVTSETDVSGIAEAVEKRAQVIMMADDQRFVALNATRGLVVDNSEATGKGFTAGLDLMTGGLKGQKVLVIGCGPVGQSAALEALHWGAEVSIFDIDSQRSQGLAKTIRERTHRQVAVEPSLEKALSGHCFLIEATNTAGIIDEADITPGTYIAAPGMPLGLTPAAVRKVSRRLLHDPLQLGVAVMAVEAVVPCIQ